MSIENKVPMSDFTEVTDIADTARIIGLQDNENVKIPLQSLTAKILSRVDEDILTVNDINVEGGVTGFNPIGQVAEGDKRAVSGEEVFDTLEPLITISNSNTISNIVNSNGNSSTSLSVMNNTPATVSGTIREIKGRFPSTGVLNLFVAEKISETSFKIIKITSENVSASGLQTIELNTHLDIKEGQFVGVSTSSTSKPYYGVDETLGLGWFRIQSDITENNIFDANYVNNTVIAFSFKIESANFYRKTETYTSKEVDDKLTLTEQPYILPSTNYSSLGTAYLSVAVGNTRKGYVSQIRYFASEIGQVQFQVLKRITFNADSPSQLDAFEVQGYKTFTTTKTGENVFYLSENELIIEENGYLAIVGGNENIASTWDISSSVTHLGWFQAQSGGGLKTIGSQIQMIRQNLTPMVEYSVVSPKFVENKTELKIHTTKVTVTRNSEDYNSIRDLANSLESQSSYYNRYEILIPNGVWYEIDWQGWGDFIKIIGSSKNDTKIVCDPMGVMAAKISPSDYSYSTGANIPLNQIIQNQRHLLFAKKNIYLENMSLFAIDCKYTLHLDATSYNNVYFKSLNIKEQTCNYAIGMGVYPGQRAYFDSCKITRVTVTTNNTYGTVIHNSNNKTAGSNTTFKKCLFDNCDYAVISELGSNHVDNVIFEDCFSNLNGKIQVMVDRGSDGNTFWTNPITGTKEPNPVNVPYCMTVTFVGMKLNDINSRLSGNFNAEWANIPQRDVDLIKERGLIYL